MKTKPLLHLLVTALICLTHHSALHAADAAADMKKLEGVWEGAAVEGDGSKPGSARARISELIITPQKISAKDGQGNSLGEGTYKVQRIGNVLAIDANGTGGPTRDKQYFGILLLEGDTLKWCSGNPGKPRPTEFRSVAPNAFLMVLKRKKS